MTDEKNATIEPTQLDDDQLEGAVGGRLTTPVAAAPKPRTHSGDPCEGGQ